MKSSLVSQFKRGVVFIVMFTGLVAADPAAGAWQQYRNRAALALIENQRAPATIPPLPENTFELRFEDFYARIVGARGLEYTDALRALDGKRVRVLGHMVREPARSNGVFMLTPWPTKIENDGFCIIEDLPPATLHVMLPGAAANLPSPYLPGRLLLTGTLEVGPSLTADGRNSAVRLRLDAASAPWATVSITQSRP